MKIKTTKRELLPLLKRVCGIVDQHAVIPVYSHALLSADGGQVAIICTDSSAESSATLALDVITPGSAALPARKLLELCRALPDDAEIAIDCRGGKAFIQSGRSRLQLSTLPGLDFPRLNLDSELLQASLTVPARDLRELIAITHHAIAHNDVRHYLNGLLIERSSGVLRAVATDGHRLALCDMPVQGASQPDPAIQAIVPRKSALEIMRLLNGVDAEVQIELSQLALRLKFPDGCFVTKLIDASYPDYGRVIPAQGGRVLNGSRSELKESLARVAVLAGDKFAGVVLTLSPALSSIRLVNEIKEEAKEELTLSYQGGDMEIGYNVAYLLDAINAIGGDMMDMFFSDNHAVLFCPHTGGNVLAVVMPMRI